MIAKFELDWGLLSKRSLLANDELDDFSSAVCLDFLPLVALAVPFEDPASFSEDEECLLLALELFCCLNELLSALIDEVDEVGVVLAELVIE